MKIGKQCHEQKEKYNKERETVKIRNLTAKNRTAEFNRTAYLSIITFHINGLNSPTKKHRKAEWIKKKTISK